MVRRKVEVGSWEIHFELLFCPTGGDSVWRLALEKLLKHVELLMLGLHSYVGLTYCQSTSVQRPASLTIHILRDPTWRTAVLL